jgi:hypothetical protein
MLDFIPEELSLLLAQSYAAIQDNANARIEFIHASETFCSPDTRAHNALWAANTGDI